MVGGANQSLLHASNAFFYRAVVPAAAAGFRIRKICIVRVHTACALSVQYVLKQCVHKYIYTAPPAVVHVLNAYGCHDFVCVRIFWFGQKFGDVHFSGNRSTRKGYP